MTYYITYSLAEPEALWRVCGAISKRGIDVSRMSVSEENGGRRIEVQLAPAPKQQGQLEREWLSIVGVRTVTHE